MEQIAQCINILGRFCGKRDVPLLNKEEFEKNFCFSQTDVLVLFGGSILCGGDVLAQAMQEGVAKHYLIVGGEGHTTQTLRDIVHARYPHIKTDGLPEAKVFAAYLKEKYNLQADALECVSTNCGNNITNLLALLDEKGFARDSIILMQDATMQHRMHAGLQKHAPDTTIINFATYQAEVVVQNDELCYASPIDGMWNIDRYVNLLMGEIPRLRDDASGYGPKGQNFIAHVDIPDDVEQAFTLLQTHFGKDIREANPLYATK